SERRSSASYRSS
ncbi:aminoacyl tRNA synthetase class II, N-terminal domain protein, partial [Vibrio parahaemolyticus V-223/04]